MTRKQLDQITAALAVTLAVLVGRLSDITRRTGGVLTRDEHEARPVALLGGVEVGDLVSVYAHQRYRVALVWKVTRTKLSAVYVTPTALDEAARYGRDVIPNNITARIVDCSLVEPVGGSIDDQPAELPAEPAPWADAAEAYAQQSTDTCDHGRLLWQSCRECGVAAHEPPAPAPVDEPAQPREIAVDDHAAAAGMLPLAGGDGFLF